MRGRKPFPTVTQRLRGNPGKRPLNENEPRHPDLIDESPEELAKDPIALAEWNRVFATLNAGHISIVDRATFLAYCLKYSQWKKLEEMLATEELVVVKRRGGPKHQNPLVPMANNALKLVLKTAAELGITPSSRTRIVVVPRQGDDPRTTDEFARYQRKRLG
jgi:P27 family predicted phage terminase small subunit